MRKKTHMRTQPEEHYWYNTRTNAVEYGKQSLSLYRLGPFSSAAEAARALDVLRERSAAWAAEDERDRGK